MRTATFLAIVSIIVSALALSLDAAATAQTPEPSPTNVTLPIEEAPPVCPPNRPEPRPASRETAGSIWVFVPEGRYYVLEVPPGSGFVNVCLEDAGGVRLASDCSEVSRYVTNEERIADLDAIVASCEPAPTPAPTVGMTGPTGPSGASPTATTSPADAPAIRPPDTGSGGLR